jgi:hypothetical protein
VKVEPDQEGGPEDQQDRHQQPVVAGLEDPDHHQQHPGGRQDRPGGVEGMGRIRRQGIDQLAAEQHDHGDHRRLEQERGSPADGRGDQSPNQRAGGGADAPHAADAAERPGARGQVGEDERGQDVDGRDQQGRAEAFQERVAKDQDAEPGGDRAQKAPTPYTVSPTVKQRLRPTRSDHLLPGIIRAAMTNKNRVIAVCTP